MGAPAPSSTTTASVAAPQPKPLRREGLSYVYEPPELGIRLRLDYVVTSGASPRGELSIEKLKGPGRHIYSGAFAFGNIRDRVSMANYLTERTRESVGRSVNWLEIVEIFSSSVLKLERQGSAWHKTGGAYAPRTHKPPRISKLLPNDGRGTIWYGPAGTGKGWLAVYAAVCMTLGRPVLSCEVPSPLRVAYLDWEDDQDTFDDRVTAICNGLDVEIPELHYRQMKGSIARHVNELARYRDGEGIAVFLIDSAQKAIGVRDRTDWEADARLLFEAVKLLDPATSLIIDHVSGEHAATGGKLAGKAYGGYMKMAEASCAWEVRKEQGTDEDTQVLALYHTKHNKTRKYAAMGVRLVFASDAEGVAECVGVSRTDIRQSEELSKNLSLPERLDGLLAREAMATRDLAKAMSDLGRNAEDKIRNALNRGKKKRRYVQLPDGRWGLSAEQQAQQRPQLALVEPEDEEPTEDGEKVDELPF